MNGVLTVIVKDAKKLTTDLLNTRITLSFIRIPLSIIPSFSFVFIHLDPKSGGTGKGVTAPIQVYHIDFLMQVFISKNILG